MPGRDDLDPSWQAGKPISKQGSTGASCRLAGIARRSWCSGAAHPRPLHRGRNKNNRLRVEGRAKPFFLVTSPLTPIFPLALHLKGGGRKIKENHWLWVEGILHLASTTMEKASVF